MHPSAAPTQQYASSSLNNDQMSSLESAPSGEYSQRYPGYTGSRQDRVNIAEYPRDSRETSQQSSKKQSASNQRSRFDNFAQSLNGGRSTVNKQVPNSRQGTWRPSSEFVDRSRQQQAQHPERSESSSDDIRRAYSPYSSSDNNNNRAVMSTSQQRTELNINGNRKEEQESERRKQQRIDDEERKREQQEREERQRLEYERRQREYERRKEQLDEYRRRLTEQQLHQKQSHPQQQQHHHQQEQAPHQKTLDVSQRDNVNDNKWASEQRTPPVYGSDEDEEYVDYSTTDLGLPTKPAPFRAQIPPTPAATVWPTPFTFADSIPCAAFTDDVCYQQAKYLCCANQNNSHFSSGDGFSRCCYENFVHHGDTCCPLPIAKYHWSSTSELCLPNVRVDLSELRVVAELGDSKIVSIDFGEDRSWDYDCDFSSHTSQFVYVPGDDSADSTADR
ncbi:unnamed protein product [Anisakis simplex]|uniref:Uncharacterized protein n=1 Tax=Anisakis simplex TaxID=6269 RepID=A0A3P6QJX4_ANISI|nr:unnamed protein product [Anisakis simplex]